MCAIAVVFFFQAEDGIRDLVRSRGLGDVYKRQTERSPGLGDMPLSRPPAPAGCSRPAADEAGV